MTKNPGNPGLPPPVAPKVEHFGLDVPRSNILRRRLPSDLGGGTATAGEQALFPLVMMNFTAPTALPVNGNWGPPTFSSVHSDLMVKGNNWEVYKNAVLARGVNPAEIVEITASGYNVIQFQGMASVHFHSLFDITFVGHAPSIEYVNAIKAVSRVNTKVGTYFASYEDVSQQLPLNDWWQPIESVCIANLRNVGVAQTGLHAIVGCQHANHFQLTQPADRPQVAVCGTQEARRVAGPPHGPAPHDWICDLGSAGYPAAWAAAAKAQILSRYGTSGLDYLMVDNVFSDPLWGAGVPVGQVDASYTSAIYRAGQKAMWATTGAEFSTLSTKLCGNCALGMGAYAASEVPRRYGEHFFHDDYNPLSPTSEDLSVTLANLTAVRDLPLMFIGHSIQATPAQYNARSYSATAVDRWSGSPNGPGGAKGTWSELLQHCRSLGITNKVHAVSRGGTSAPGGFPLFWQDSFRPIS